MAEATTYTVTTVAGSRQHVVHGLAENLVVVALLGKAYSGENPGFYLSNPTTFYTLSNVISVSFEGGIPEVVEEVERKLGFAVDDRN